MGTETAVSYSNLFGGLVMNFRDCAYSIGLLVMGVFVPSQAFATTPGTPVPEPVSLALIAVGAAGMGAAAFIRRRKDK